MGRGMGARERQHDPPLSTQVRPETNYPGVCIFFLPQRSADRMVRGSCPLVSLVFAP